VHAALSLFDEKFLWDELRFRLTPAEILKLEAANQFYDYEQSVTRRYIKYALNFILDAKRSKIFFWKTWFTPGLAQKNIYRQHVY